jgi:formate--tetrahydrofolate ligase
MIVAYRRDKSPIYCRDIKADGAMTVLLKDAMQPNLVQTLENNPAFVHGGPFANIAHGCNSVIATKTALKLADFVVTEAGFGADLGAEKFMNIKCRKAGPGARRGGAGGHRARDEDERRRGQGRSGRGERGSGAEGLRQPRPAHPQREGVRRAGGGGHQPFRGRYRGRDRGGEGLCRRAGVRGDPLPHWAEGGAGIEEMARRVAELAESGQAQFAPLYPDEMPLFEKIERIAKSIYHASEVIADKKVRDQLREWEAQGYGNLPVCMAKTQYSFSTDPNLRGAPEGHTLPSARCACRRGRVRCGDLRRDHDDAGPAARAGLRDDPPQRRGLIEGLF